MLKIDDDLIIKPVVPIPAPTPPLVVPNELQVMVTQALKAEGPEIKKLHERIKTANEKIGLIKKQIGLIQGTSAEMALQEMNGIQKRYRDLGYGYDGFGPPDDLFQLEKKEGQWKDTYKIGDWHFKMDRNTIDCVGATFRAIVATHRELLDQVNPQDLREVMIKWMAAKSIEAIESIKWGEKLTNFNDIQPGVLLQYDQPPTPTDPHPGHSALVTKVDRDNAGNIVNIHIVSATNENGILKPAIRDTTISKELLEKYRENGLEHDTKHPGYIMHAARLIDMTPEIKMKLQHQVDDLEASIRSVKQALEPIKAMELIVNDPRLSQISDSLQRNMMAELIGRLDEFKKNFSAALPKIKELVDQKTWDIFEKELEKLNLNVKNLKDTSLIEKDVISKLMRDKVIVPVSLKDLDKLIEENAQKLSLLNSKRSVMNLLDRISIDEIDLSLKQTKSLAEIMVKTELSQNMITAYDNLRKMLINNPSLLKNIDLVGLLTIISKNEVKIEFENFTKEDLSLWLKSISKKMPNK